MLRKLIALFTPRERMSGVTLLLMMALGALLEVAGIGLIAPIVGLIADPQAVFAHPLGQRAFELAGVATEERFTLLLLALFTALIVCKNLYLALLAWLQNRFIFGKQATLSKQLLACHLYAPYARHLQRNSADVMRSFATEISGLFAGVVLPLLAIGAEVMVLALVVTGLLVLMPQVALIALLAGALMVGAAYAMLRSMLQRYGRERAARSGTRLRAVSEALAGLKELKVLGVESHFLSVFGVADGRYLETSRIYSTLGAMPRLLMESLTIVVLVGTGLALAAASDDLRAALPSLALLCAAMLRLMPAATRILGAMASIRFYAPILDQVHRDLEPGYVAEEPMSPTTRRIALQTALEVRGLEYRYPDASVSVLRGINIEISAGSLCGLVGASGAGKSTLADLILGLLTPQHGMILVDGAAIAGRLAEWRRSVGYVPQTVHLLDDSVRRNVAFGVSDSDIDDNLVWKALELAQLAEMVRSRPGGLDEVVGERGVRISGGQRQRLGIARSLYRDPPVLVLDEATSALDAATENAVADALFALRGTRTIIVIAHRQETIRRCDKLFLLSEGTVQASGTPAELAALIGATG